MSCRVSVRKGSNTALDPHGVHSEMNTNSSRSLSSTLTIVRIQPTRTITTVPNISDVTPQRKIRRTAPSPSDPTNRVSFAFSSFSQANNTDQLPSPSSSPPRLRPSSPLPGRSDSLSTKLRPTPDQLVDLARQATNPRPLPRSPVYLSHSITQTTFTPLPDNIYLPFIDRPSEVAALISSPPDLKLFSLLAQTFSSNYPIITSTDQTLQLPSDPTQWSYHHLVHHLTHIDRDIAPDPIWAVAARKCIHSHSELIWERIKGALGVPPELDHDQLSPPPTITHQRATLDDDSLDYLSIEPLLAVSPSSASTSFSSHSDRPPRDALGGIAEGAEEDETELVPNETISGSGLVTGQGAKEHSSLPIRIQGLKISTSPMSSSNSYGTPLMSPISPLPHSPVGTRSDAGDAGERDGGYMRDGERLPGCPLFPSNFTKLAMGPIPRAK